MLMRAQMPERPTAAAVLDFLDSPSENPMILARSSDMNECRTRAARQGNRRVYHHHY